MTTPSENLRALAAAINAEADKLEGVAPGTTYYGVPLTPAQEAERKRLAEIANRMKPHAYVAPGIGVLHEDTGTGEQPPRSWDTHSMLRDAAQRGDPVIAGGVNILTNGVPGWPGPDGNAFRADDYIRQGPEAMHSVMVYLFLSPEGKAWTESVGATWPKLRVPPTRW